MIKNLVFDLGNVLVEFTPKDYLKRIGIPETDIENLAALIFKDKRWNEFDRGTITIEEYTASLKSENPQYSEYIESIFSDNWAKNFFKPKEKSIEFLKKCSEIYGIYVLSNVSEYVLDYIKTLDFFEECVTSGTYSYQVGLCKPEIEIYETFLADNELVPEECLFLDDLPQNIEAAKKMKMNGILFNDNIKEVVDFLKNQLKQQSEDIEDKESEEENER